MNDLKLAFGILACVACLANPAWSQFGPEGIARPAATRPADESPAAVAVRAAYEQNLTRYKNDADMLVRSGLLADRKEKTVRIWGRATGISGDDPVEFFLIPQESGKDYEAMFVGFARPSDVRAALEFIGMKPGRPVDYVNNDFWPRGERVVVSMEWKKNGATQRVRAEDLLIDTRAGKTMAPEGFVFTGSFWMQGEDGTRPMLAADVGDSMAIVSDYNNRSSVLDVPRQAAQGNVYGSLKANPAYKLASGDAVEVMLEPAHKDGKAYVRDLSLRVSIAGNKGAGQAAAYVLADASGKRLNENPALPFVLAEFEKVAAAGEDPFVTLHVDDAMTLGSVKQVYALLSELDNEHGIRIEGPPPGNLYYRAFFPNDEWRDRTKRLGRPWELHLVEKGNQVAGTLILPADDIDDNNGQGDLKFTVGSAAEMARVLGEKSGRFSQVVYIFAPATMDYGDLMDFIKDGMKTHPAMWVFVPK